MDDAPSPSESEPEPEPIPIPALLHSAYLEGPFKECVSCGADLRDPDLPYQVQKSWRSGEVVFELAICARCAAECLTEFSRESLERLQAYFQEHYTPRDSEEVCHFCGTDIAPGQEFGVAATCRGPWLAQPLVVICGECNERSQEKLSRKTRDAWGEFIGDNLPGVPRELEPDTVPFTF